MVIWKTGTMSLWWESKFNTHTSKYHISCISVTQHTHTNTLRVMELCLHSGEWPDKGVGGGSGVNEVHSFRSQLAPEERQWGGKLNLKEGKLCQQVTEACSDQTHSEVKRSHITGPIWKAVLCTTPLAFLTQPVSAQESCAAAPNMN